MDPAAVVLLSAGRSYTANKIYINNSSENLTDEFGLINNKTQDFNHRNTSDEYLQELVSDSNGNFSQSNFKAFNASNLILNLEEDTEENSLEKSDSSLTDSSSIEIDKFPQPLNNKEYKKSHQILENGESDVFDQNTNNERPITTLVNISNNQNNNQQQIITSTLPTKKIHSTIKPKPLAFISSLSEKVNRNKTKKFGGINIIPESRFKTFNTIR